MAYLTFLYSVPGANIIAFRNAGDAPSLNPSKTASCFHIIAYWVQIQPLGKILGEVIDGGELLQQNLEHPFRPPLVNDSSAVKASYQKLQVAWDLVKASYPIESNDWYGEQIESVLSIFAWAGERGEAVVTALGMKSDSESADSGLLPATVRRTG